MRFLSKPFRRGQFFCLLSIGFSIALAWPPTFADETPETTAKPLPMRGFRFGPKETSDKAPDTGNTEARAMVATETGGEISPSTDDAEMKLGRVREKTGIPPELAALAKEGALAVADRDWKNARRIYLKMVQQAPDNELAYANLGVAEHQLGNLLAAAGNLGKSVALNPHIARNWQTLGLINYERGELALAISNLTRSIHEEPGNAEARLILAAAVRDYGWIDAAVTELQRAVELDPRLASAHYNLAVTYLESRPPRVELARRHYYAAIDLGSAPSPEIEAIFEKSE